MKNNENRSKSKMVTRRQLAIGGASGLALLAMGRDVEAQAWPSRVIRIVSAFGAGGPNDLFARRVAEELQKRLGQPVIVENRVGADGRIGADSVAKAEPDGHTLLMLSLAHTAHASLFRLPYDLERDFQPISRVASVPLILVVANDVPVRTTAEFIALAKARPGQINYASGGNGTSQHLAMAMFATRAGISMQHVAYRGLPPALADMLAGQIQAMMSPVAFALQHVRAGRLRVLGITTVERSPLVPEAPTIAAAGLDGFRIDTWHGLVAPRGTPADIIARLNRELRDILAQPALREGFLALGALPSATTPEEFGRDIGAEIAHWGRVIRDAGIEAPQN